MHFQMCPKVAADELSTDGALKAKSCFASESNSCFLASRSGEYCALRHHLLDFSRHCHQGQLESPMALLSENCLSKLCFPSLRIQETFALGVEIEPEEAEN